MVRLRVLQAGRMATTLGLPHLLLLLAVLATGLALLWSVTKSPEGARWSVWLSVAAIASLHQNRNDRPFADRQLEQPMQWFLAEYMLLLTPLWLCIIAHGQLTELLWMLLLIPISILKQPGKHHRLAQLFKLGKLLPREAIEWKAGLRRFYLPLVVINTAGFAAAFYPAALPLSQVLTGWLVMGFFEKNESLPMLRSFELPPSRFLWRKIALHARIYSLISLPPSLIFIFLHPEYWFAMPLLVLTMLVLHTYAILVKYTFYDPQQASPAGGFFRALGGVAALLPLLFPLILLLGIRFYFKALNNIKPLLHDFD